ncbi:bifunctional aminoglycoside phosphotransferase/ATP-binding protein [Nitratireductor sp. StC3]|uniref:bifunctional aminoglycoside phosphotransferase/ATP-binding protein n=1 Tax=Nitratireductor sp. StC3 TaxID=2126741 RepID=UPI000D0CE9F2|nr:bifunctional aminoglycoside phosphotransferase/ATP-binding protein [Nitratireductor sp. StC3]PSM17425.1 aminoglycoside phosphotransferase [Nitratireductor sp. StC3]
MTPQSTINEDGAQDAATGFLSKPETYRLGTPVEVIETHISRIFLVGDRAFKMKRAVRLPYVDFSTPQQRLSACRKEVTLNSRTAPDLYLGTRRITATPDGGLEFDGDGALVDAVVEMKRFDQSCLLDRQAEAGTLTPRLMRDVARAVLRFHDAAPVVHDGGGADNIAGVLDINAAGFATSTLFSPDAVAALGDRFRATLARHAALLDARETAGKVRRCHGDLHLRNICVLDGVPCLFDCIEFNDQIATVDVLYDLAFLLMDLWHRGHRDLANLVMNRYFDAQDEEDGFVLLAFFMAVRAAVRAHVTATQYEEGGRQNRALADEARSYFDLAGALLEEPPARLTAIGGLSGSGKTTVAEALAAHVGAAPGARILESDRLRKAMFNVAAETRLPAEAYSAENSARVYADIARRTRKLLDDGGTVVADAVFDRPGDRARIRQCARDTATPFIGIWLDAGAALLQRRVSERSADGPSDATVAVLAGQLRRTRDDIEWTKLDAARPLERIVADILALHGSKSLPDRDGVRTGTRG